MLRRHTTPSPPSEATSAIECAQALPGTHPEGVCSLNPTYTHEDDAERALARRTRPSHWYLS